MENMNNVMGEKQLCSLLKTTQNTRELGGYRIANGSVTKTESILRSDIQNYPCEEDFAYLKSKGITTIIDMRGQKDVTKNQAVLQKEMISHITISKLMKEVECRNHRKPFH